MVATAAALLVLIAMLAGPFASAAPPTPGQDRHFFEVRVVGSGSTAADYGEERKTAAISTSGVDGEESLQWRWELRAVAYSIGSGPLKTRATMSRGRTEGTYSIISWSKGQVQLGEERLCTEFVAGTETSLTSDGRRLSPRRGGRGDFVGHGRFELYGGELRIDAVLEPRACFHGLEGGLKFSDGTTSGDASVPRGEFNPRSDQSYRHVFESGPVSLDRSHGGDPNSAHTFTGQSRLEVEISDISERRFDKLVDKYQHKPVNPPLKIYYD
jgi:hypothetical protein